MTAGERCVEDAALLNNVRNCPVEYDSIAATSETLKSWCSRPLCSLVTVMGLTLALARKARGDARAMCVTDSPHQVPLPTVPGSQAQA